MKITHRALGFLATNILMFAVAAAHASTAFLPLQPLADKPGRLSIKGSGKVFYVPSTLDTILWGYLPNATHKPVLTVPSGATVVFDTVSHEGILEDQGRNPVNYFGAHGISPQGVLKDAIAITSSGLAHDFAKDGPHVVTGPVAIEGAEPGDVLKVDIVAVTPRVPYGVISNRHGKGALPGEFPEGAKPESDASATEPEKFHNVSIFTPIKKNARGQWQGILKNQRGERVTFRPRLSWASWALQLTPLGRCILCRPASMARCGASR